MVRVRPNACAINTAPKRGSEIRRSSSGRESCGFRGRHRQSVATPFHVSSRAQATRRSAYGSSARTRAGLRLREHPKSHQSKRTRCVRQPSRLYRERKQDQRTDGRSERAVVRTHRSVCFVPVEPGQNSGSFLSRFRGGGAGLEQFAVLRYERRIGTGIQVAGGNQEKAPNLNGACVNPVARPADQRLDAVRIGRCGWRIAVTARQDHPGREKLPDCGLGGVAGTFRQVRVRGGNVLPGSAAVTPVVQSDFVIEVDLKAPDRLVEIGCRLPEFGDRTGRVGRSLPR
jgi:hypothetical protein